MINKMYASTKYTQNITRLLKSFQTVFLFFFRPARIRGYASFSQPRNKQSSPEHLENGIRNHGKFSPKIGQPFRKLLPHPFATLAFTLDSTNCFHRNEIKGGGVSSIRTCRVRSLRSESMHSPPPLSKNLPTETRHGKLDNWQPTVFWRFFARGFLHAFWQWLIREQARIEEAGESANWEEAPSNHRLVTSRQRWRSSEEGSRIISP